MKLETIRQLNDELASSPILIAAGLPVGNEIEQAAKELGIPFSND